MASVHEVWAAGLQALNETGLRILREREEARRARELPLPESPHPLLVWMRDDEAALSGLLFEISRRGLDHFAATGRLRIVGGRTYLLVPRFQELHQVQAALERERDWIQANIPQAHWRWTAVIYNYFAAHRCSEYPNRVVPSALLQRLRDRIPELEAWCEYCQWRGV